MYVLTASDDRMTQTAQDSAPVKADAEIAGDDRLMAAIATGDQRAFEMLMHRHLQKTVRLAARMLGGGGAAADDVAQEAFLRVWKHAARFEESATKGARFTTWLYRIVLNIVIDEKRKARFSNIDDIADPADETPLAETTMQRRETGDTVNRAIAELPDRQRAAFTLCFREELSNKEAADILDISVKALESLLVRARRTLRDSLKEMKP